MLNMKSIIKHFCITLLLNYVKSTIDGLSYMDSINRRPNPSLYPRGEDPCNPLYWYPRNIPDYCNYRNIPIPGKPFPSHPMPIPVPIPQPNLLMPIPALSAGLPVLAPLPYGVPIIQNNPMLPSGLPYPAYPHAYNPYTSNTQEIGMVPGLPGLVTKDGGINILPFSDAYSDLIENHKNKMIRRKLEKIIQHYEDFPNRRSYRRLRKYSHRIL